MPSPTMRRLLWILLAILLLLASAVGGLLWRLDQGPALAGGAAADAAAADRRAARPTASTFAEPSLVWLREEDAVAVEVRDVEVRTPAGEFVAGAPRCARRGRRRGPLLERRIEPRGHRARPAADRADPRGGRPARPGLRRPARGARPGRRRASAGTRRRCSATDRAAMPRPGRAAPRAGERAVAGLHRCRDRPATTTAADAGSSCDARTARGPRASSARSSATAASRRR